MSELELYTLHPLGGRAPLDETVAGLRIQEVAGRSLVSVAARPGAEEALRRAVLERFGVELPPPGRLSAGPRLAFAWMGQGQWFADARTRAVPDLAGELSAALGGNASLTEQSDAWVRLRLAGTDLRAVLEKLCMLDLHDSRFPPGAVARTVVEHLGAVILRPEGGDGFELWSARCSARSFREALHAAARAAPAGAVG